jgi:hypothetical protein
MEKQPIDFIVFAVRQAQEAQFYGFTRNEACRNLKIAIHQYWQNKTLGLHGQSQKANIPRSKAAVGKPLNTVVVEHVVPQMHLVNAMMDMAPVTTPGVLQLLKDYFAVMVVTKEEHDRLNASGLRSTMPDDWDKKDVLARYRVIGIEPADPSLYERSTPPEKPTKKKKSP